MFKSLFERLKKIIKKPQVIMFLFCFVTSFLFLTFTSKNSFLYAFNDWEDVHAFFTVGKSMFNGRVLYKDIFEQKGPYLYLIYGFAYLISNTSFIGVFILEVFAWTIFFFYVYKIMDLYIDSKYCFIIIPIMAMLIFVSLAFKTGGSCESFIMPLLIISVYTLLKYVKDGDISYKKIFIIGLFAGIILFTKYTLLGINFAFIFYLFFSLIYKKKIKKAFISCLIYLSGMFIAFIPWLIYFILNDGLYEFFNVYFYFNIFYYPSSGKSIFIKIIFSFVNVCFNLLNSGFIPLILVFLSIILFIISRVKLKDKLAVLCMFCFTIIFIYIGGIYFDYYCLPLFLFLIFIFIGLGNLFIFKFKISKFVIIINFIICLICTYKFSYNTSFIELSKDWYAPYRFSDTILEIENPKILNYGWLDCGFYFTTDTIPNVRYFEKQNVSYDVFPDNIDEQNNYIKNKEVDFVIVAYNLDTYIPEYLDINYELVEVFGSRYDYPIDEFRLYKLREENQS